MTILCTIDLLTREVSLPGDQCIAAYDHNVDVIHFQAEPIEDFSLDTSSIKIAAQGPNNVRHDYAVDPSTVSIEEETGYITFDWPIPQGVTEMPIGTFKYGDKGQLIFSVCAEIIDGSTLSQAWHSDDGIITVVAHLEPESGGGEDPSETATNAQKIAQLQTDVAVINTQVGALGNGSPAPVSTVAEMTDESTVYLYTGSETGYTAGNWYYYDGSAWTSGGTYGGAVTDTTLSISGSAADAKAVGDALALKADSADVTALGTRMTAVEGNVSDLAEQLYTDGDAVEIQKADATSFVMNSPSGLIHVKATTTPIITGTTNFIDLFELAQGVFTDSDSGVTIEITGNEVYVHGSPTKGFRFDFQNGVFFTDAFTNHASDFGDILGNVDFYNLTWYEKTGYTLPSNVYIAAQKQNGTINPGGLNTHVKAIYPKVSNQYIAMYTNGAVSNLDIKFTLGMTFNSLPIKASAQTDYNTTVIRDVGYYETKAFTWTLVGNVYDVVKTKSITAEDPLTKDHVYAWFGDSLSQLKELPNIVAGLLNVTVYDCTFAGAPLTYGNPTKYQPTGFMSLCSQIVAGDFTPLSDALDAQEAAGTNVTEKRQHLATLESLDFSNVTDIVLLAGTNDFDNDYVNATNFVSGFSGALTTLLTEYPHLMVYVISPPWRGDKTEGTATIPTMEDLVELEKGVADDFSLPWYDLYHRSGINALTATVFLTNDLLHPSDAGDALLANKCAKFIQSN